MDQDEFELKLLETFLAELEEHLQTLNEGLLVLERNPDAELRIATLQEVFRSAHSLKGAARSVKANLIESTCHQLESILSEVRDHDIPIPSDKYSLLFETIDGIDDAAGFLRAGQSTESSRLPALIPDLKELALLMQAGDVEQQKSTRHQPGDHRIPAAGFIPTPSTTEPTEPESRKRLSANISADGTANVRVSAGRLDTLMSRNSELLVARRRIESRSEQLDDIRESILYWRARWSGLESTLLNLLTGGADSEQGNFHAVRSRTVIELQAAASRISDLERSVDELSGAISNDSRMLARTCSAMDHEIHRVRMVPFRDACAGLARAARDLAASAGKQVSLSIEGGDVEMDRSVVDGLKDPLLHLVRNAVDHGIEKPAQRNKAGKDEKARIVISATLCGAHIEITVADDGRGLNLKRIRRRGRSLDLPVSENERELTRLIFLPGFSTNDEITSISGRGIGLDVVRDRLESLHGEVDVSFEPGIGTSFRLIVPLTLTTMRAMLVNAGDQTYAIPNTNVVRAVRLASDAIRQVGGRSVIFERGETLSVASLSGLLQAKPSDSSAGRLDAVIISSGQRKIAMLVDEVIAEQEIVVNEFGSRVRRIRLLSGANMLASGEVGLVLNIASLIDAALLPVEPQTVLHDSKKPTVGQPRLLLVEDSATTRMLLKIILESAGYHVSSAVDGEQAASILRQLTFDLIISDVDMPGTDGFSLTRTIRRSSRHREVPVILVTSLEEPQHRQHGIASGANEYLTKSEFDQSVLLAAIERLLPSPVKN